MIIPSCTASSKYNSTLEATARRPSRTQTHVLWPPCNYDYTFLSAKRPQTVLLLPERGRGLAEVWAASVFALGTRPPADLV